MMKASVIMLDGMEIPVGIESFIATHSPMRFDIMVKDRYYGQILFPCTVGIEYEYSTLKSFCRLQKPSLENKDFDLLPTTQPRFKN